MQNISLNNKLAGFSNLSDQECALLIQSNLLEAFDNDIYFEWEVVSKMTTVAFELREILCRLFGDALKRNEQLIAGIPIKSWMQMYLSKYPVTERRPSTFFEFIANGPELKKMDTRNQIALMRIFRMYDYLFVVPFFDLEDWAVANILSFRIANDTPLEEIKRQIFPVFSEAAAAERTVTERIPLREIIKKYPKTGEQMVTNSPINLKGFDRPVRSSVRNWIYDYTSHLGQSGHTTIDRTDYIFRSENAARLTSQEREKLGIILKSFDENTPLPVDGQRQEVVFNEQRPTNNERLYAGRQIQKPAPAINYQIPKPGRPAVNYQLPQFPQPSVPPKSIAEPQQRTSSSPLAPVSARPIAQPEKISNRMPDTDRMQFVNPYPKPGTHEPTFAKPADNISNVSFSEGLPDKDSSSGGLTSQVLRRINSPVPKTGMSPKFSPARTAVPAKKVIAQPTAETRTPQNQAQSAQRNIIRPHHRPQWEDKPEPKIDGNIVDLSGKE